MKKKHKTCNNKLITDNNQYTLLIHTYIWCLDRIDRMGINWNVTRARRLNTAMSTTRNRNSFVLRNRLQKLEISEFHKHK